MPKKMETKIQGQALWLSPLGKFAFLNGVPGTSFLIQLPATVHIRLDRAGSWPEAE